MVNSSVGDERLRERGPPARIMIMSGPEARAPLPPPRIGDGDLVGNGGLEMRHQDRVALVAFAGAQLAGELSVELVERAVAAQQFRQPLVLAGVGRRAQPRFALQDGE